MMVTQSGNQRTGEAPVVGVDDFNDTRTVTTFTAEPFFEIGGLLPLLRHSARSRWNANLRHFPHHLIVEVEVGLRLLYFLNLLQDHLSIEHVAPSDRDVDRLIQTGVT